MRKRLSELALLRARVNALEAKIRDLEARPPQVQFIPYQPFQPQAPAPVPWPPYVGDVPWPGSTTVCSPNQSQAQGISPFPLAQGGMRASAIS